MEEESPNGGSNHGRRLPDAYCYARQRFAGDQPGGTGNYETLRAFTMNFHPNPGRKCPQEHGNGIIGRDNPRDAQARGRGNPSYIALG